MKGLKRAFISAALFIAVIVCYHYANALGVLFFLIAGIGFELFAWNMSLKKRH
ncbi:hypothetical protein [uncultured Shewanella sp.]|uniref:hypothetical protein n=1 Tax=uncultured Shewanella sp. TaxID=173975 RepID=UPI002619FB3F|nr:hypothetical protein [uncultured Shewanella sp.]